MDKVWITSKFSSEIVIFWIVQAFPIFMELFPPSGQAILTVRRLLHNLEKKAVTDKYLEMEHMNNFVRYVKEVARKSFSKFKIFSGNMRYLIAITENDHS